MKPLGFRAFVCDAVLFATLLQLPHLAISGAFLLPFVAIPCILIAVLLKVPVPEKAPLFTRK